MVNGKARNGIVIFMVLIMMTTVNAIRLDCTPQEENILRNCIGQTQWDWYYQDWCYRYDFNTDGVINLSDVGLYAQQCANNGGNKNEKNIKFYANLNND